MFAALPNKCAKSRMLYCWGYLNFTFLTPNMERNVYTIQKSRNFMNLGRVCAVSKREISI